MSEGIPKRQSVLKVGMVRKRKPSAKPPDEPQEREKKSEVLESKEVKQNFSAQQIEEFRRAFDHFDEDGSGDLSVDEIKSVFKANGLNLSDEEFDKLMVDVDEDGNGTIDFNEFLQAMAMQQANRQHIKNLQHTVQRVIKLTKQVLPMFLPLSPDDPRFAEAERQRAAAVRRVLEEKEGEDKDMARKQSAARAVESQEKARENAPSKPKPPVLRSVQSRANLKFKKGGPEKRGEKVLTDAQGEKLSLTEALCKAPAVAVNDERLRSYEAFESHHMTLFCPVTDTIITDVDQTFCVLVDEAIANMALVDEYFNPVKVLPKHDVPSEARVECSGQVCFYGTMVVPRGCQKLYLASRKSAKGIDVQYEVFCQFQVQTLVEFAASSTTLKDAAKALQKASKKKDDTLTLQCAEIVLYFEPTNVGALLLTAQCHQRLGHYRLAARAAEALLGLPKEALGAKDSQRQAAYEVKAASELSRGFFNTCKFTCTHGLAAFPKSSSLQSVLQEATSRKAEEDANAANVRAQWAQPDARAIGCPEDHCESVETLVRYLSEPFDVEVAKIRAIFRWICDKVEYDAANFRYGTYAESGVTPEGVLQSKRAVCQGYVNLFKAMCEQVGCECVVVTGFGRVGGVDLGEMKVPNHAWNLFKVDGQWYPADCTWASGSLNPDFSFKRDFNPFFWMTPAPVFLNSHFPEDTEWQLVEPSLSREEFLATLCVSPFAFACGLEVVSHNSSNIVAKADERIAIRFKDTNADHVFVYAQLKEWDMFEVVDWETEVAFLEKESVHEIVVDCKGLKQAEYELTVYAAFHEEDAFTSIATYKVLVGDPQ